MFTKINIASIQFVKCNVEGAIYEVFFWKKKLFKKEEYYCEKVVLKKDFFGGFDNVACRYSDGEWFGDLTMAYHLAVLIRIDLTTKVEKGLTVDYKTSPQ